MRVVINGFIKNRDMTKKIMFNDRFLLTQAVLEGRKTQTRRLIDEKLLTQIDSFQEEYFNATLDNLSGKELIEAYFMNYPNKFLYKLGEVVAVAQSYETISESISHCPSTEKALFYCKIMKSCYPKEEIPKDVENIAGWNNKMFVKPDLMPHQIRITGIRVERLQDISDEDCLKEGIIGKFHSPAAMDFYYIPNVEVKSPKDVYTTPREAYAALIDKVSGKGTWEKNPYVFVYDFELVK